ncbi:MAG: group II intron reverse transcriptase/maturase [Bacteroidia bacterium]|nr:group II intron reverse transcriptase/maturase [Bacteroidia bacterium]
MKDRMQKISKDTCQRTDRAEPEGYVGGQTYMRITENNFTNVDRPQHGLLEEILSPNNLNKAYRRVKGNDGACGVDGMGADELLAYLTTHKDELLESILNGRFRPNPVRRVEIPKDNGKKRQLGIPTVVDRVIQQAIAQTLSPLFEKQFSATSYGFRPKRSAHQALRKCQEFIDEGYIYAIDMDLEKFFDTVNQSKLVEVLSRTIKDGRVISLIHKYLMAGAVVRNKFEETEIGVPQGGPLSPLLSNIMLNELDKELEQRGHRFVRYADDCVIVCKSKRSAERTLANILPFIEQKLFLKVNREKTVVAYVRNIKFLGHSFYMYQGKGRLRVHPKSLAKMKETLRVLTSRSNGWGNDKRKEKLKQFITGWVNYFKLADMKAYLVSLDSWLRRRLRMVIWKQWKRVRTRLRNLIKLGIPKAKAYQFANTRKGYWRTAKSPILSRSICSNSLVRAGYTFFSVSYGSCQ